MLSVIRNNMCIGKWKPSQVKCRDLQKISDLNQFTSVFADGLGGCPPEFDI